MTDTKTEMTTDQLPLPAEIDAPGDDVAAALEASADGPLCSDEGLELLRAKLEQTAGPDPVAAVEQAVANLEDRLSELVDAADDPEGEGLALMLNAVRTARTKLYGLEALLEREAAHAMMGDQLITTGLRVERYRARDRKEWRHDDWQRDVRAKALRKRGLLHAIVVNPDGEQLPDGVLYELLADVQAVHGAGPPKTTVLKQLGLSGEDYCHTEPGSLKVKVQPLAESQGADD